MDPLLRFSPNIILYIYFFILIFHYNFFSWNFGSFWVTTPHFSSIKLNFSFNTTLFDKFLV